tara:strand:+ start:842 stop:2038 length:1197 start_codon:yes stop_codon:yes gene_type:complete
MTTTIELGAVEGFILDDPIAGVLDNVDYTLGGVRFVDIADSMVSASVARGKNRDLDRYASGKFNVLLNNEDRRFDPNYSAGPLFGNIIPRREIKISKDGVRVFTGIIEDWNFDYAPAGSSRAEIVAVDEFTNLAREFTTPGTATPQKSGERVAAILDSSSVDWPADRRDIDTGVSELGADTIGDGDALDYLQKVTASEQGALFMNKSGELQFRSRLDFTPTSTSVVEFSDDGSGVPYSRVNVNFGTELLLNTVTVESLPGNVTSENERSRISYGIVSETISTLLSTTSEAQSIADWVVEKYADPEFRFSGVELSLDKLTSGQRASVLALELGSVIKITFTPNGIGDPVVSFGQVIRLDHEIGRTTHDMVIGVAAIEKTFLVLNDAVFGTMDSTNVLAF